MQIMRLSIPKLSNPDEHVHVSYEDKGNDWPVLINGEYINGYTSIFSIDDKKIESSVPRILGSGGKRFLHDCEILKNYNLDLKNYSVLLNTQGN